MGSVGTGGRVVDPERAPETPWRTLLASRFLPQGLSHSRRGYLGTRLSATIRWRAQPAPYGAPLGSLTPYLATPTPTGS